VARQNNSAATIKHINTDMNYEEKRTKREKKALTPTERDEKKDLTTRYANKELQKTNRRLQKAREKLLNDRKNFRPTDYEKGSRPTSDLATSDSSWETKNIAGLDVMGPTNKKTID
ncbi:hypothetical protein PV325_013335, partial [Microctonus aethiopoides]